MIRRELFKFAGGAATGLAFTPLPWRLLGDTAIWTQNWAWMPRTPRGEVEEKEGHCTLCPAGCAVKIKTCAGTPIGVWPRGEAMCPAGLAGHTLAWHPLRLRQCLYRGQVDKPERALEAAKEAMSGGVAVLDLFPGRTASLLHRMHLASIPGARYIPAPLPEGGTARMVQSLLARPAELAVDLENAKTVLSVGTPILDGWAAPGRSGPDRGYILWQADTRPSRSAELADTRLILRPGGETALLLGLGRQLLASPEIDRRARALAGYEQYREAAAKWTLPETAARTGLEEDRIVALAKALESRAPAAVIADGDPLGGPLPLAARAAASALNAMLAGGAFAARRDVPVPDSWKTVESTPLESVPDASIGLLLIDEPTPGLALPWKSIEPKLKPGASLVVALTWNRSSYAQRAHWLVPVPVYLEQAADAPVAHDTPTARLAASPALMKPPEGVMSAVDFVAAMSGAESALEARLEERSKFAEQSQRPAAAPLRFARLLPEGVSASMLSTVAEAPADGGDRIEAYGWRLASTSPLLGKLWQEWDLRPAPGAVSAHPDSLRELGWNPTSPAKIEAEAGKLTVQVHPDSRAPKDLVTLHAGPAYTQICEPEEDGAWRLKNPKVVRS